jgi:hypothetical protein
MRNPKAFWILATLMIALASNLPQAFAAPADDHDSIVVVFKDGRRQTLDLADIARIDLKAPSMIVFKDARRSSIPAADAVRLEFENPVASMPGKNHFLGKWRVGEGNGSVFYITLEPEGIARKSLGSPHGTWTIENGEARIIWDDGWHDAIRKVGARHEKWAYEPGKSFDSEPSNVTAASLTEPKPI